MGRHGAGSRRRQRAADTGGIPGLTETGGIPRVAERGPRYAPPYDTAGGGHRGSRPVEGVRGGHPQHSEHARPGYPQPGYAPPAYARPEYAPPRPEYVDAFDSAAYGAPASGPPSDSWAQWPPDGALEDPLAPPPGTLPRGSAPPRRNRARRAVALAAVVTTLALGGAIAVQMMDGRGQGAPRAKSGERAPEERASRAKTRPTPPGQGAPKPAAAPPTYAQAMAERYPLSDALKGPDRFEAVGAPTRPSGRGAVVTYRVEVEEGLPLDGALFAEAVHKTLSDPRSWGHGGERAFQRVGAGQDASFVITLASPGTTDTWCAKSGLNTSILKVSCDSSSTRRVMINAYRWAQGSETYGDRMYAYRQMVINHEVGHRLGRGHVGCPRDGAPAPVMMQQTKFLSTEGRTCKPNPWPYPEG
ncbi:DUF3152 domain-containing protein [Streptomyces polyrhachis]|uniref:DUF3152 domain-containing protein n=1 Tax=Streptomyces polyrhachis TaxID=1282885 RepID=A0ABW2GGG1_9ACTN